MTKIFYVLKRKGLSVSDFCRAARIYPPDAYQIRKGARSVGPTVRARISEALGVKEESLFDPEGWPRPCKEAASA